MFMDTGVLKPRPADITSMAVDLKNSIQAPPAPKSDFRPQSVKSKDKGVMEAKPQNSSPELQSDFKSKA